ncbi:hypothetical protein Thal_1595 [Thermocrinis albus DSM 14484]|uniref:Lipoprotein n=1 Tax=Thermocrinis albus (strain DSM 14484 / JCM 11386 / HI 11/12) TaxID=638303 RepID=D3SN93_THEAH|nr:hypothetical protein [Thermocrinis albus]ADC90223.1 hypothetical protein Thal_1595 [Thermocrinis albus DSM 14484]
MRVLKLGLLISCAFLPTSCFLVAETAQRSIDAGRLTINQTPMTTTGAVGGIVAGTLVGILLSPIANAIDEKKHKSLSFLLRDGKST